MNEQIDGRSRFGKRFGNGMTLEELSRIEEQAHRSGSTESRIILRLTAALREAMQIEENALALTSSVSSTGGKKSTATN
jgi:hypothetical protein